MAGGFAPRTVCTGSPFLSRMKVGMAVMRYFVAISRCSSTSTFAKASAPSRVLAMESCSKIGAIILHGGHHDAVKSMRTYVVEETSVSNCDVDVMCIGFDIVACAISRLTVVK
jgi:hypothetical protein